MKKLSSQISVGAWVFDFVTNVEITSSWDTLTDTCTIEIPRNISFKRDGEDLTEFIGGENPVFFRGDQVIVKLGYDGFLKTRFMGRLSDVMPRKPLVLVCEDESYRLKQAFIDDTINFEKTTLKDIINTLFEEETGGSLDFIPESDKAIADVSIEGKIDVSKTTVAKVLDFLRSKLGIVSYWRANFDGDVPAPIFVSGLPYSTEEAFLVNKELDNNNVPYFTSGDETINEEFTTKFKFGQNIIDDEGLTYKRINDQKVLVTGASKQKDNSVLTYEAGNEGGDVENVKFPGLTQSELESFVQERVRRSKYEGFEGSFDAFLEPMVRHGETVEMINNDFPEKNGIYLIKEVTTKFGVGGGRQVITLDARVDAPILNEEPIEF